ncbi:MAG: cobalamin biosynthesis protein CobW, partial [Bacteroidales bacterium]|nr:cobalamin biosynthesis protein CobW [Bacteroidales bacterium]
CDCHEHEHEHKHEHKHEHEHEHHHHDCHCHEHEHHHEAPFGIETFLYYRRGPFDMNKFDYFVTKQWPKEILRAKGLCWFEDNPDMSCIFEQAGEQKQLTEGGYWYAAAPPQEWMEIVAQDPKARDDWDEKYGDRMQKIVFIGKHLDKHHLIHLLDNCLTSE